ncbi:hypothetical protein ACJIZ3_018245 [Penstemon smallii]|uniref:BRO1 domain-containing protein n=1 Tax=Penstemon smallii TaxID=265156 RepID=A0ABD3SZ54_9LAMI
MGCTSSVYAIGTKKKENTIPEVSVFVPSLRIPIHSDHLHKTLRCLIPCSKDNLAHRISSLRNQIVLLAQHPTSTNAESGISEIQNALEEYLPLLLGLTIKEHGCQDSVEFKWKELETNGEQEICVSNSWFELLSVLHTMSMLTLTEANLKLIPKGNSLSERLVSPDCMRDVIDLFLKAAGYLNFCVHDVLPRLPHDIKKKLPADMQESALEATTNQALAQGTDLQLGLALQSKKATLSVKRRLSCEQLSFLAKAHCCLSEVKNIGATGKKQLLFLKWRYTEAKAAAYYYHGLILDKVADPSSRVSAMCCFLAAQELLVKSKKACLTFCLAHPITRAPPPWGAMKQLHEKIQEVVSKKTQNHCYIIDQEKLKMQILPDLPKFELSLQPDDYELPDLDSAWINCEKLEITGKGLFREDELSHVT